MYSKPVHILSVLTAIEHPKKEGLSFVSYAAAFAGIGV